MNLRLRTGSRLAAFGLFLVFFCQCLSAVSARGHMYGSAAATPIPMPVARPTPVVPAPVAQPAAQPVAQPVVSPVSKIPAKPVVSPPSSMPVTQPITPVKAPAKGPIIVKHPPHFGPGFGGFNGWFPYVPVVPALPLEQTYLGWMPADYIPDDLSTLMRCDFYRYPNYYDAKCFAQCPPRTKFVKGECLAITS